MFTLLKIFLFFVCIAHQLLYAKGVYHHPFKGGVTWPFFLNI